MVVVVVLVGAFVGPGGGNDATVPYGRVIGVADFKNRSRHAVETSAGKLLSHLSVVHDSVFGILSCLELDSAHSHNNAYIKHHNALGAHTSGCQH